MKRVHILVGLLVVLLVQQVSFAQPVIGLSNLNGFPTFITNGTHYDLEGWIVNTGNASFSGTIDLEMMVEGTNIPNLDNNFNISSPLAPGDSIYWSKNNHNFPSGQFRLGVNDVLIWPTVSTGQSAESDTASMTMYYSEGAILRLDPNAFLPFGGGMDWTVSYDFDVVLENIGTEDTQELIGVWAQIEGESAKKIASVEHVIVDGANHTTHIAAFQLSQIFPSSAASKPTVSFFVLENGILEPYNQVNVALNTLTGAFHPFSSAELVLFPNPSNGHFKINLPGSWKAEAVVKVYDATGRLVFDKPFTSQIEMSGLVAGYYQLQVISPDGQLHQSLIVE